VTEDILRANPEAAGSMKLSPRPPSTTPRQVAPPTPIIPTPAP
jgi:hypothetical protein